MANLFQNILPWSNIYNLNNITITIDLLIPPIHECKQSIYNIYYKLFTVLSTDWLLLLIYHHCLFTDIAEITALLILMIYWYYIFAEYIDFSSEITDLFI